MKLQLGAYERPMSGWVNHDQFPMKGIDVIHNLDIFPWPWKDNSCDEIYASHVIEHLHDPIMAFREMLRILKPGGTLTIRVPYYNSPNHLDNADHKTAFGRGWFKTAFSLEEEKPPAHIVLSVKGSPTILGKIIPPIPLKKDFTLRDYASTVLGNVYWEITAKIRKI